MLRFAGIEFLFHIFIINPMSSFRMDANRATMVGFGKNHHERDEIHERERSIHHVME